MAVVMTGTRYKFVLTGLTDLLLHADDIDWADHMGEWRNNPANRNLSKPGDDRSPGFSWIGSLTHDGERVAIPSEYLTSCFKTAGARVKLSGRKTMKEGAVSAVWIDQEFLPLLVDGKEIPVEPIFALKEEVSYAAHVAAVKKMGFELFKKRATIGKAKHIRVRPRFERWSVEGTLEVTAREVTAEILDALLFEAGRVGIGDWRPGGKTPGRFGMFDAEVKKAK
jgi:hypothetical protein